MEKSNYFYIFPAIIPNEMISFIPKKTQMILFAIIADGSRVRSDSIVAMVIGVRPYKISFGGFNKKFLPVIPTKISRVI